MNFGGPVFGKQFLTLKVTITCTLYTLYKHKQLWFNWCSSKNVLKERRNKTIAWSEDVPTMFSELDVGSVVKQLYPSMMVYISSDDQLLCLMTSASKDNVNHLMCIITFTIFWSCKLWSDNINRWAFNRLLISDYNTRH